MKKILAQGAEAKIILSNNFVIKDRIRKSYRIPELDNKIRKQRTKSETKLLEKASRVINVPKVIIKDSSASQKYGLKINKKSANDSEQLNKIMLGHIKGKKLSDHFDSLKNKLEVARKIGESIAKLHSHDIIHGDLTTSNMILVEDFNKNLIDESKDKVNNKTKLKRGDITNQSASDSERIFFIDFGLGFISKKIEDKAVDLHLLKEALEAKHFKHWQELWKEAEESYKTHYPKEAEKVLERLRAVERRGRYKDKY